MKTGIVLALFVFGLAAQNRSSSDFDSLSVGSIIMVPETGQETVGA